MESSMRYKNISLLALSVLLCCSMRSWAQGKLLTIDDIYDPVKRVDFNGTPPRNLEWLKDGDSYLQGKTDRQTRTSVLMKVNARNGNAVPFFDEVRMKATLLKLLCMSTTAARDWSHRDDYILNRWRRTLLINIGSEHIYKVLD